MQFRLIGRGAIGLGVCLATILNIASAQKCPFGDRYDADVLILGAGMSGISAANTLTEMGNTDFLILEARQEIGGRMQSREFGGVRVSLGSTWIHSAGDANPIWRLTQRCKLGGNFTNFLGLDILNGSEPIDRPTIAAAVNESIQIINKVIALGVSRRNANMSDISAGQALEMVGYAFDDPLLEVLNWLIFVSDYAVPSDQLSLYDFVGSKETTVGGDFLITDARGIDYLAHCLASEFNFSTAANSPDRRLHLNTTVTTINWNNNCVCVDTSAGDRLCGRKAISTFSIGVLQSDVVTFNPPLPQQKTDVINTFDIGLYIPIILRSNTTFWIESEFFSRIEPVRGQFQFFVTISNFDGRFEDVPSDANILVIALTSEYARNFLNMTSEKQRSDIIFYLEEAFPSEPFEIEELTIVNWLEDPLFQCSYSAYPPGVNEETVEMLAAPIGSLYFSGEVTERVRHSTIEGAYLAGAATARRIATAGVAHCHGISLLITVMVIITALAA